VKLSVDEDLCAASALCTRIAPELFELPDDSYTAVVLRPEVSDDAALAAARDAVASCPAMAISLTD
jgi:ferredoxin